MPKSTSLKFITRLSFVIFIYFIFKAGDYSFNSIFDFSFRSIVFSLFFLIYWLLVWYMAEFANKKLLVQQQLSSNKKQSRSYFLFIFHAAFGFVVAFGFNCTYRNGDIYFFDNAWDNIPILNPELTFSLLAIYLVVFTFDIYILSILRKKEDEIQMEKLKQENILAKYLNLKSQIEPHFLFNSLSVLSSLIYTNVDLASDFILKLSKILRYVIERNDLLVVPLKDEIAFVDDYVFLMNTRFEESIVIEMNIDAKIMESCIIPPVSLQLLIENAIKHNRFDEDSPLCIQIDNASDYMVVRNKLYRRNDVQDSTKKGLDNLLKRFSYLSNKPMKVEMTDTEFIVYLPIISSRNYESANI